MKTTSAHAARMQDIKRRSGHRHWFRLTGLPGWKRALLGMPAFGRADCSFRRTEGVKHGGAEPSTISSL